MAYNQAVRSLQIWKRDQEEWYAEFGLESPKVLGMAKVTTFLYIKNVDRIGFHILAARPERSNIYWDTEPAEQIGGR